MEEWEGLCELASGTEDVCNVMLHLCCWFANDGRVFETSVAINFEAVTAVS